MDKKTLEKIKQLLSEQKGHIEQELQTVAVKDTQVKDNYESEFPDFGDDEDENANEIAAYTDNLPVEQQLEKTLRDINSALKKIAEGDYGACKYCGKDIPVERLLARPSSSSCVDCKEKIQRQ